MNGIVRAIFIAPEAGAPMQEQEMVFAVANRGISSDRYGQTAGSFNKGSPGRRQVTLINARFFDNSGYTFAESRRNIVTEGVELNWLSENREFTIGGAVFRGVKYCDPCERPTKLAGKNISFREAFRDCGGIIAEVVASGFIRVGDVIVPPPKGY
jgi:MOSC domain-containing protein YiiM